MSIEILNESDADLDVDHLAKLARFVMDRMRVHPQAELCIKLVDEATIAELNEQWMGKEGPTDVLAFPMDELRPGLLDEEPEEGVLGDLMVALTTHGILHLLGYDHAEADEHKEMFDLQAEILREWGSQAQAPR